MTLVEHIKENYPKAYKMLEEWRTEQIVLKEMYPILMIREDSRMTIQEFTEWPNQMTLMYLLQFLIEKHYSLSVSQLCPEHIQAIIESGFEDYEKILMQTTK